MKRKTVTVAFLTALTLGMVATGAAQTWNDNTDGATEINIDESDVNASNGDSGALADDSFNVDMAVTSEVQLDVKPEQLNFPDMEVGTRQVDSERNFQAINLQNTGSEYIDTIWVDTSTPETDPFRQGTPDDNSSTTLEGSTHDAGNFIQVRPREASNTNLNDSIYLTGDSYHFVNRKEYAYAALQRDNGGVTEVAGNADQIPEFINADPNDMQLLDFNTLTNGQNPQTYINSADANSFSDLQTGTQVDGVHVGTMRVGSRDYYYALLTSDVNDVTTGELRIADADYEDLSGISEPSSEQVAYHNGDTFGAYDFTDNGAPNEPIRYDVYEVKQLGSNDPVGLVENLLLRADNGDLNFADGEAASDGPNNDESDRLYDVVINQTDGTDSVAALTRTRYNPIPEKLRTSDGNDLTTSTTGTAQYLFEADAGQDMLKPGQSIAVETGIEVPRGVVQGKVEQGTLTVALTSDNTQTPGQTAEDFINTNQ